MGRYDYTVLWDRLKTAGYNTTRIRKEGLIGQRTLTNMRAGKLIGGETMERLCELLSCQPGDIMRYISDAEEAAERSETSDA